MTRTEPAPATRTRIAAHPAILLALAIGIALGASMQGASVQSAMPAAAVVTQ